MLSVPFDSGVVMTHRKHSNKWMAAVASLVVWVTSFAQGHAQNLYIPDNSFNAGNVRQGDPVEHAFPVRNPGHSVLTLQVLAISHPGIKIRMPQEIRPGDSGRILVTWDTRLVQGESTAEALLRFNDAENVFLNLAAKVIPPIEILPYPAVFISGFRDEGATRSMELLNHDPDLLNVIAVSGESAGWERSYSTSLRAIEPGRRYQLRVELKNTAPGGRSTDTLIVRTDHPRFGTIRIPVNLFVKEDVYINPESVDFGQVTGKAWSPETFLLNTNGRKIKVLSATSDLPFLRVKTTSTESASTHEFRVEIAEQSARGPFTGTISIKTDDAEFPELKASVYGEFRD
ncbi:MAG TPA: DUF1573 domain-containing protein [Terriglobia bacterium]|nr:DUF1573 domain-containing protein [Terriglobia bacterium]